MSLLRDIQTEVASTTGDVISVLRNCKILAARLHSEELIRWVDLELDGFPDSHPTPPYRNLSITYYASFRNIAWHRPREPVPMQLVPENHRDSFRSLEFREGIAKVVSLARENKGARVERPELIPAFQGKMWPQLICESVWGEIPNFEFEQLLSSVKNRVLDFSLKIEFENPEAGEALPNTQPVPREKLQVLVQNTFYGPVGNLAQSSEHFSQSANIGLRPQDLSRLVNELTDHLDELNLDPPEKKKAEAQIATLKAQLAEEPDPIIVKQAGRTLRSVTEGALGSLLATAAQPTVWHWIHQALVALTT